MQWLGKSGLVSISYVREVIDPMDSRECVKRTLQFQPVDRIPRDLWALPGIVIFRIDEYQEMIRRYPLDFISPDYTYGSGERVSGVFGEVGQYTDAWGCVWHVGEPGVVGEVKEEPIAEWSALNTYRPPYELLLEADLSRVNRSCAETDKFVKVGTETRPFERLQFLRGTEKLFLDLAYGDSRVFKLLEMLHDFFMQEMHMWAETDVDGVSFMDDWGSQTSLLISPDMWRQIFKPLYKDYCDVLKSKGKFVFFHSDGNIRSIYPDLIEIGIDAVNSQLFCMDMEELGDSFSGKITFWGEIDRQHVLPFGIEDDVRASVRRVCSSLGRGDGGVIAQCEWGNDVSSDNIAAVFDEWNATTLSRST